MEKIIKQVEAQIMTGEMTGACKGAHANHYVVIDGQEMAQLVYYDLLALAGEALERKEFGTIPVIITQTEKGFNVERKIVQDDQKKCVNHCPKCGAGELEVEWGKRAWSDYRAYINATCQKCGCEFTEVYLYAFTEIDQPVEPVEPVKEYPLPHPNPDE